MAGLATEVNTKYATHKSHISEAIHKYFGLEVQTPSPDFEHE